MQKAMLINMILWLQYWCDSSVNISCMCILMYLFKDSVSVLKSMEDQKHADLIQHVVAYSIVSHPCDMMNWTTYHLHSRYVQDSHELQARDFSECSFTPRLSKLPDFVTRIKKTAKSGVELGSDFASTYTRSCSTCRWYAYKRGLRECKSHLVRWTSSLTVVR